MITVNKTVQYPIRISRNVQGHTLSKHLFKHFLADNMSTIALTKMTLITCPGVACGPNSPTDSSLCSHTQRDDLETKHQRDLPPIQT